MKKKWKLIGGIVAALACILAACTNASSSGERRLKPNYLLTGIYDQTATDDMFDYYDIGNDEYAVALKDSFKTYTNTITIPTIHPVYNTKKVTGIWHDAFYKSASTNIVFASPSNINTIDFEAFLGSKITSITIPYTVDLIGDGAFYACSSLTKVTFTNSNQESSGSATNCSCDDCIDDEDPEEVVYSDLRTIPSLCFFKCNALTELSLPSHIEEICEEAFNGCSALSSSLFFQNIKIIRSRAFQGCTSLSNVYISKSLFEQSNNTGIEPHAFNYCDPDLTFRFCGTQSNVNAWVSAHPNWGWRVDRGNPAESGNSYNYILTTGDNYFTADWVYTVDQYNNVTITAFNGTAADVDDFISIPDHMPYPAGNKVIYIERTAFTSDVKAKLKRIYLPTTLMSIANWMFYSGYSNLYVIDDNTACATDFGKSIDQVEGRIDLSGLNDLEFIGIRAFTRIGSNKVSNKMMRERIKTVHLPARLRAVGGEAFGEFGQRYLPAVETFLWDYNESTSRLETIGADAFYGLGISEGSGEITGNVRRKKHTASTIIFPSTFKYFGMLTSDINSYLNQATNKFNFNETAASSDKPSKDARPAHAFSGCPLLGKVVFKGSLDSSKTTDLVIPLQTFVYNESLRAIIFEERAGHFIEFHTQTGGAGANNDYAQEAIGGNSGRGKNDFRGEPFLQTLVLPNKYTHLRVQRFAFHANARGVIYLSDSYGTNMYYDHKHTHWKNWQFEETAFSGVEQYQWRTIGDETFYNSNNNKRYYGYCFAPSATTNSSSDKSLNTFSIEQKMPVYENIHFVDEETGAEVGAGNSKQLVMKDKCAFVCEKDASNHYVATMSNYLYTLYDPETGNQVTGDEVTTVKIPETVTANDENNTEQTYTVTKIGDSAFSACFCDGKDFAGSNKTVGSFDDLTTVIMPDTIKEIGEYAFIRAYGVTTIKSYTGNQTPEERMPTSLRHIGKNAFLFSSVTKLLKIPYECLFYENENNVTKITSVFANDVSLRAISFLNAAGNSEVYTSKYYEVTTYTANGGDTRAAALYSRDYSGSDYSGETLYNSNRLLLVLNRDYADNKKASVDASVTSSNDGLRFNGKYKNNEFLFGAYKMGYWIKELVFGKATTNGANNPTVYDQPLFSGIGKTNNNQNLTVAYIYLGENANSNDGVNILYEQRRCDLTTIAGEVFDLPNYGLNGCENLIKTELGFKQDGVLPEGVFANITNTNTQYVTGGAEGNVAHTLDLRTTGYIKVSKNTFKNNSSINKFIAPDVPNFTIDESAFDSCANLTTIDLSAVTNTLTINARAFANTPITSITWPSSPCTVIIQDGTPSGGDAIGGVFEDCTSLATVNLPTGLTKLGNNAFNGCTNLTTVGVNGASVGITAIGGHCFDGCTKLDNFDFSKFTSLVTIGGGTFLNAGKINNNGNVELPSTVTTLNNEAFKGSKVVTMTFTSNSVNLGASAFEDCTSLTAVRFDNGDAAWVAYNASVFNDCTALTELQLPTGFNMSNTSYSGNIYFISGDSIINIYVYEKFSSNAAADEGWRRKSNEVVPVHYFVESVSDLTSSPAISGPGDFIATTEFWTTDANGHAINLGTITAYDGTTVTFSSGYTLTGTTFVAP